MRQGGRVKRAGQQVGQCSQHLWLLSHLQAGRHLIHHADQRFMGVFGLGKEALADCQTTVFHSRVQFQQGMAELLDGGQLGQLGTAFKRLQFGLQVTQFLTLAGMLAPATQQILGVQQDIHALGKEDGNHLRIALFFASHTVAGTAGLRQALPVQAGDTLQQLGTAWQGCQRVTVQLLQAGLHQLLGGMQQFGFAHVQLNQVGLELLDHLLQRGGNLGNRQDAGHEGTALERMQGALQVIGNRLRQFLGTIGQESHQGFQMGERLIAENIQQQRVQFCFSSALRIALRRVVSGNLRQAAHKHSVLLVSLIRRRPLRWCFATRQRMGGSCQEVDIITLALCLGGKLIGQCREQGHYIRDHLLYRRFGLNAAVENTIEHVLDRPGELANDQRTHHAPAALEGVERATQFGQRFAIIGIGTPLRQVGMDGLQYLGSFLNEDFQQLLGHRLFISGRRQQAGRHILGRWIDRLNRRSHHIGDRQFARRTRRFDGGCLGQSGQLDFRQLQFGDAGLIPGQDFGLFLGQ